MEQRLPKNLIEAVRYFSNPDVCTEYVAKLRWPNGPVCPRCESTRNSFLSTRRLWKCRDCKKQFSVKVGTIFEDSPIPLDKWLAAVWLIANSKNGISSHELGRAIGLTQKSAWFVLHRIRLAMSEGTFDKFDGETEVDETFVGGLARNMHVARRKKLTATGGIDKTAVGGVLQRSTDGRPSRVRATVIGDTKRSTLHSMVRSAVSPGSIVYSDALRSYRGLSDEYKHEVIDHATEYVVGKIHTNGMENFWSLLKRGLRGSYVAVAPFHLIRYVDERVFTFNERDLTDLERFSLVVQHVSGRRLTWESLTAARKGLTAAY